MQHGLEDPLDHLVGRGLHDRAPLSRFEVFLFGAVATVLITRAFLAAAGYPQVGGGNLHVAHVLWGGLLMGAAIVALVILPGGPVKMRGALVGGIGFGLFIDEIGKFLTKDVDYFFQPAIAIMYVVFVGFYLVVRIVLQRRRPTDRRRLATGLDALSDQARGQLRPSQRDLALALLEEITDPRVRVVAAQVRTALVTDAMGQTGSEYRLTAWRDALGLKMDRLLAGSTARRIVLGFFVLQAALSVANIIVVVLTHRTGTGNDTAGSAATVSGGIVTVMTIIGVSLLLRNRYLASLRVLHAAIVINLLVGQVFLFASEQFGALAGFALALVMLAVLQRAIRHEELDQAVAARPRPQPARPQP